jgi:diguanylate cyclase (GGDEF)-like protein/PAS domain S-box-containing protein
MKRTQRRLAILFIVAGVSAALLLVQSLAARKVVSSSFAILEQHHGERSIDQVLKAIEADLNQLAISVHDYAVWDDAFDFVIDRNPHFIKANMTAQTMSNLEVDFVWMVDSAGRDILQYERAAPGDPRMQPTASAAILEMVRAHMPQLVSRAGAPGLTRLFQTRKGLLAVAASPILPSEGTGVARGVLMFGRFVNQSLVKRAQVTSQLPLKLYLSTDVRDELPPQARSLWRAQGIGLDRALVPLNAASLGGYVLLRDVEHSPVALVAARIDRSLNSFGRHTGRSLIIIFSVVMGVFALIVGALLLYLEQMGHARSLSERRYRAVITEAQETMLLVDTATRRIVEANPAATTTLGYSVPELLQMNVDDLFCNPDGAPLQPSRAEAHAAARPDKTLMARNKNKDLIDVEVVTSCLMIDEREVTSFVLYDVSARKRAERQLAHNQDRLAHLAHHDMLTGLLNRLGLERRLPEIILNARYEGTSVAFLYIDLDHFKKINDLRGHACGDKLLQIAAERLRNCLPATDLIVRMGGDEFVVVSGGLREAGLAAAIAGRVRDELAAPFEIEGQHLKVTASIGVSSYPQDGADYAILLQNADIALYESKESGRDNFSLFTAEMTRRVSERLALELELREAIHSGQFYLDYQPLVDPKTQRIASLEALVRWQHPQRGKIPPLHFIGIAERTGQICEIGAFVIREVCQQIGAWQQAGVVPVPVAINVSSKQLEQRNIIQVLKSSLASAQISPSLLRIEITESVFMDAADVRVQHLNELRQLGIQVSVDDFGTGYSSLAYLKHLPVDCLKIDRAFVRDITAGGADEEIVKAIIHMADKLGLSTVAEGVETQEQARRLSELGATYIQGYYYSPPVAADACGRLLRPQSFNYAFEKAVLRS